MNRDTRENRMRVETMRHLVISIARTQCIFLLLIETSTFRYDVFSFLTRIDNLDCSITYIGNIPSFL